MTRVRLCTPITRVIFVMATRGSTKRQKTRVVQMRTDDDACDPEIEQRLKSLQRPAACSFVLSMVERYIRSLTSRDLLTSSLPSKEALMSLIDTYILNIPPSYQTKTEGVWPFSVFEELELLESLRIQVEERQTRDIQMALFDAIFGIAKDDKVTSEHRLTILKKIVSLAISGLGNGTILHCTAYWMELYPSQATDLAQTIYFEFCEFLPNAMDPLLQLGTSYPSLAKLVTHLLTSCYPMYLVKDKITYKDCPPIKLIQLVSHWLANNPNYLTSLPLSADTRDNIILLRSQPNRNYSNVPLTGLTQWSVLEPLIPDSNLIQSTVNTVDGVAQYRTEVSRFHANLLAAVISLTEPSIRMNLTANDLAIMVTTILDLQHGLGKDERVAKLEISLDRLAQVLQICLHINAVTLKPDDLFSIMSPLPKNRLLTLVCTNYRKSYNKK